MLKGGQSYTANYTVFAQSGGIDWVHQVCEIGICRVKPYARMARLQITHRKAFQAFIFLPWLYNQRADAILM